jgi:hypothetical protein
MARCYLPAFSTMREWLVRHALGDGTGFLMRYEDLLDLIRHLLVAIAVDETWYRQNYLDVNNAIEAGNFESSSHHYIQHGYFENRQPFPAEHGTGRFPVPFAAIEPTLEVLPDRLGLQVRIDEEALRQILRGCLQAIPVDEVWYRGTYPGIAEAIAKGDVEDAAQHFVRHGYFEGRWPYEMPLDEYWYLGRYPDVKTALDGGAYRSAREHYERVGYREGRLPARFWFNRLWDRPWVAETLESDRGFV